MASSLTSVRGLHGSRCLTSPSSSSCGCCRGELVGLLPRAVHSPSFGQSGGLLLVWLVSYSRSCTVSFPRDLSPIRSLLLGPGLGLEPLDSTSDRRYVPQRPVCFWERTLLISIVLVDSRAADFRSLDINLTWIKARLSYDIPALPLQPPSLNAGSRW